LKKLINQCGFHDQYTAEKKLGKGSQAIVYLSKRNSDQKMFAVKAFEKNINAKEKDVN
jgi:serine/threonine protein kinase